MTTPTQTIQTGGGHGHAPGCSCPFCTTMRPTAEVTDIDLVAASNPAATTGPQCACAHNRDGSTTTMLCPVHSDTDPCLRMSQVTGKRRVGSIKRGTCTNCGWTETAAPTEKAPDLADTSSYARATQPDFPRNDDDSIDTIKAIEQGYVTGFETIPFAEPKTLTLVGHWDGNTIVVEDVYDGDVEDDREETGYWDQGLWSAAGTGTTEAEVAASMLDEYEQSHAIRFAVGEDDRTPADDDEDEDDEETCIADDCDESLDDGEGFDGYCGTHSDKIEGHNEGQHRVSGFDDNGDPANGPDPECPNCNGAGVRWG